MNDEMLVFKKSILLFLYLYELNEYILNNKL